MLATGEQAPDFTLPNQNGETMSLSDLDGPLVLYFYPKAGTDSCTTEAERFDEEIEQFHDAGMTVVGVSTDTVDEIKQFHQQHDISFQLLSDANITVTKQYETFGTPEIDGVQHEIALRNTYVVDEDGTIVSTYEDVSPTDHPEEIIADHTN